MQRIKARTDDFVKSNFENFSEQAKVVGVLHEKTKAQLHALIQMTNLRTGKNPHFVGETGGIQFLKTLNRA